MMGPHYYTAVMVVDQRGRSAFCEAHRNFSQLAPGAIVIGLADGDLIKREERLHAALNEISEDPDNARQVADDALCATSFGGAQPDVPAKLKAVLLSAPLAPSTISAEQLQALDRYRYAVNWVGSDSWDFCSECQDRIRWAASFDSDRRDMGPAEMSKLDNQFASYSGRQWVGHMLVDGAGI